MASNTIKGLTVEIGGDTTKLGKALKDVEKQSRDLSKELGDINKLLKLDPGNTDLLAQKQEVLAKAVANTREKLDTLREAEKQVQKQFQRGEVSEEQVRALQREIVATENKMKGYEKAAKETAEAIDRVGKESDDAADGTKKTKKGADDAADSLDDMADSADKAEKSSGGLASTLGGVLQTGLTAVVTGVTAVVGALAASAETSREYRTEMGKLDTAFTQNGHSSEAATQTYKELQGILGETDQAVEAANHLAKLTDNEKDLKTWTDICTGVYATFGASLPIEGLTEAANETAKTGALTGALADALNWAGVNEETFQARLEECTTEQERQALITETLNGLYAESAEKYREVNEEVIRANQANEEWAAAVGAVGAEVEPILTDIKLLGASLLSDLVPGVQNVTGAFRDMFNGVEGSGAKLGTALSGIFTGILDKITGMLPGMAEVALSLVSTLAQSIFNSLPTLLETGGQIISSILSGIATGLPSMAQKALDMVGNIVTGIETYLPLVLAEGARILGNLGEGIKQNLPSLLNQALDMLMQFATTLYDNAPTLIQTGFDLLSDLVQGILDCLPTLLSKAPEIVSKFANIINDNAPTILKKGVDLVWQIIKGIVSAIPSLIQNAPKIITAIVDVWEAFNWVNLGKKAITFLKDGVLSMVKSVKSAGTTVVDNISGALKNLPSNLMNIGKNALTNLGGAIRSGASAVKSAATGIFNTVVDTVTSLPSKMLGVGKDLVRGLWNGISDMTGWVIDKIQGFGDSVLGGIKKFFGIESPSKVFRDEVGKMLPAGMAAGIEQGADAPLDALHTLTEDMTDEAANVNGLTLERHLQHTFTAEPAVSAADASMLDKLDGILAAIKQGQVIALDGDKLVGGTVNKTDVALGQRRVLVARGAV
jgi:phage-related minor tail protein